MPDTFDPDAWPHGGGNNTNKNDQPSKQDPWGEDDDDIFGDASDSGTKSSSSSQKSDYDDYEDDFSNYDELGGFGDYDDEPSPQERKGGSRDAKTQDDFYDENDDDPYDTGGYGYEGDQDYDDFDDFDREPGGGDGKRKLIAIGLVVFLLAAFGFGVKALFFSGGNEKAVPQQAQSAAPASSGGGNAAPAAPSNGGAQAVPPEVLTDLNTALTHWGVFATNGNLAEVNPYFDQTGDQYYQLKSESPTLIANPVQGAPFGMRIINPQAFAVNGEWVVRGTVNVSRPGENDQNFPWEFRLNRQSDRENWKIVAVRQY